MCLLINYFPYLRENIGEAGIPKLHAGFLPSWRCLGPGVLCTRLTIRAPFPLWLSVSWRLVVALKANCDGELS